MTGKERRDYENWKKEREIIDQDRIARHQKKFGEQGSSPNWAREGER